MNRVWMVLAVVVAVSCGDNIRPGNQPDANGGDVDAPNGNGAVCGDGMITGDEQCEGNAACCTNCKFTAFGTMCRASAGECDAVEACTGQSDACPADADAPDGMSCGAGGFCQSGDCETCDTAIDADFDGSNQCLDCDDTNGAARPRANELACDGVDDDCDGRIDEDYDQDNDNYSTCSDDPLVRDCDDTRATTNPGAPELCGNAGSGNGRDDNCNGYIDETCTPCSNADADGDGITECMGDCDDTRATVKPGVAEACAGFDTDCNAFTTQNCDVSDQCNFAGNADICKDDLQCGCVVDTNGQCTGNYRCASFCEGSFTGPIGAGCTATQTCEYRWTNSNNQHACSETTATLGTKLGGEICTADTECRSGNCDSYCVGPGCNVQRCVDFCDHHGGGVGSCATGTVCEIATATLPMAYAYATCGLDNNGTRTNGQSCSALSPCVWGTASCVNGTCAQPCGEDAHCPSGFHCSMRGNRVTTGTWGNDTPTGGAGQPAIETVPVCLADTGAGAHDRRGGAACTQNGDCQSQFCDSTLNVCVEPCVADASCPVGLTCEPVYMRPQAGAGIFWGRACVNASFNELLQPK